MNPGSVVEYKLCCSCYLAWRSVVGAENLFSVTVVSVKFVTACCDVAVRELSIQLYPRHITAANNKLHRSDN
jgi:hypothetical protein